MQEVSKVSKNSIRKFVEYKDFIRRDFRIGFFWTQKSSLPESLQKSQIKDSAILGIAIFFVDDPTIPNYFRFKIGTFADF